MRLIGLTGPTGSGKDTVADHLAGVHGFVRLALADPIRHGLQAMLKLPDEVFSGRDLKELPVTWIGRSPRQLMQTLGTEWGRRHIDDDIWMRVADRRIKTILQGWPHVSGIVVTDIRFANEAAWLRRSGGYIWHITGRSLPPAGEAAAHSSEAGIVYQPGDVIIANVGTIDDLEDNIARELEAI